MTNAASDTARDTAIEFAVVHALKVRGLADADALAESTGLDAASVAAVLDRSVADGQAKLRSGRVNGYMLTSTGRERHALLREQHVDPASLSGLGAAYEDFLAPNRLFKQTTTDWQLGGDQDPARVLPQLEQVHAEATAVLAAAAAAEPRFTTYTPRLQRSLDAFRGGDVDSLTKPMSGSYHDVWMELHEDLLATLGRERTDADE